MSRDPDPVASYNELYQEFLHNGNHADAVKVAANRLVELAPKESIGYLIRGGLRLDIPSQPADAGDLVRASELAPDNPAIWYLLSIAYLG